MAALASLRKLCSAVKPASRGFFKRFPTQQSLRKCTTFIKGPKHSGKSSYMRYLGVSGAAVIGAVGVFIVGRRFRSVALCESEESSEIARTNEAAKIKLYQYQTCPFCGKVRAFLEYYGLDHDIVEVGPIRKKELAFSSYKKVPTVIVDGHQLNDSSFIISALRTFTMWEEGIEQVLTYYPEITSKDEKGKEVVERANKYRIMFKEAVSKEMQAALREEIQWREWVDHTFVHVLSPNIYRTSAEAMKAMEYFSSVGNFSTWERYTSYYFGAGIMYMLGKRLKARYNLKEDVRESMYDEAKVWLKAVGKKKFMGGDKPNLADLAVYGVLSGLEGLDMHNDLMNNTKMKPWYDRVKHAVKTHAGAKKA